MYVVNKFPSAQKLNTFYVEILEKDVFNIDTCFEYPKNVGFLHVYSFFLE